jgi:hypothetical protein
MVQLCTRRYEDPAIRELAAEQDIGLKEARIRMGWQYSAQRLAAVLRKRIPKSFGGRVDRYPGWRSREGWIGRRLAQ